MRLASFALLLLAPVVIAAGCAPVFLPDAGSAPAGTGGQGVGAGGAVPHDSSLYDGGTSKPETPSSGAGGGSLGLTASYGYLCGGSPPKCVPGPGSSDCAPGGNAGMGGSAPSSDTLTCQLVVDADGGVDGGTVTATCAMAGTAADGDPCNTAADCQAGDGCLANPIASTCHPYCCGDPEACPTDTYCAPAPMAGAPQQMIPLCLPADDCALLQDSTCPAGETCAIVRDDGTTTCVQPGQGTTGQSCPCAAGYTCSNATNTCLQLCHLGGTDCVNGTCQGGTAGYQAGIGFCVSF